MPHRIAGIDVHKKMLAVVASDVEIENEYQFERRMFGSNPEHIHAYNHHVGLLPPEPLVVMQPQLTQVEGVGIVMQSSRVLVRRWLGDKSGVCRDSRIRSGPPADNAR